MMNLANFSKTEILIGLPFQQELPTSAKRSISLYESFPFESNHLENVASNFLIMQNSSEMIYILTGFPCNNFFETDGPIGALFLGNFLSKIKNRVILLVDVPLFDYFTKINRISFPNSTLIIDLTSNIKTFKNSCLISIEYPGMNQYHIQHNMGGTPIQISLFPIENIIVEHPPNFWIAVGDGGNEIGLGCIKEVVESKIIHGKKCKCGCGGGIAVQQSANEIILGFTSNFATIGFLLELSEQIKHISNFQWEIFLDIISNLNQFGILDGINSTCLSVDAISIKILKDFYDLLIKKFKY